MKTRVMRAALGVGAAYDVVLGLAVALFHPMIYKALGIEPANHAGYVQMLGLFVFVLGVMQGLAAVSTASKKDLIFCVLLMKLSYCLVVFGHWIFGSIPSVWIAFAWIDTVFAIIFVWFLLSTTSKIALPVKD